MSIDPETIVYCHGCDRRVRASVTKLEPTGPHADLERWCLECIDEIDKHSEFLRPNEEIPPPKWEDDMKRFLNDEEGH